MKLVYSSFVIIKYTCIIIRVKEASKLDGVEQIYLPGERGSLQALNTLEAGTIDVPSQVLEKLKEMAEVGRTKC